MQREAPCSDVMCAMYCPHGFKKDENGCDICECHECSPIMCMMHCEYGFEVDERGCDICKCKREATCSPVMCRMYCEHGWRRMRMDVICVSVTYIVLSPIMCMMHCEYGFEVDEHGCDILQMQREATMLRCDVCNVLSTWV